MPYTPYTPLAPTAPKVVAAVTPDPLRRGRVAGGATGLIESGRLALKDVEASCTPESIWAREHRPRTFQSTLVKLNAKASRVGLLREDKEAAEVSEDLFILSNFLDQCKTMFDVIRSEPENVVLETGSGFSVQSMKAFGKLAAGLRTSLILSAGLTLAGDNTPENVAGAGSVMNYRTPTVTPPSTITDPQPQAQMYLCLGCLPNQTAEEKKIALRTQTNIHYVFMDKIIRRMGPQQFVAGMNLISRRVVCPTADILMKAQRDAVCAELGGWGFEVLADPLTLQQFSSVQMPGTH